MLSILQGMLESRISSSVIMTPRIIAQDMIDILPNEVWNKDTTFLDPVCKSGIFLKLIYTRLMIELADEIASEEDRREHILTNQLYGICESKFLGAVSQRTVYNKMVDSGSGNIRYIEGINNIIKRGYEKYKNTIDKEFKRNMRFDVVIGNPPYNKGMDLDFVNICFDISDGYVVMITPAKWQTAADDYSGCASKTIDYKGFREKLVPYMEKIVFYPQCTDVFDIQLNDGITYYIIGKEKKKTKIIQNVCENQILFNNIKEREIENRAALNNIGDEIVNHFKNYSKFLLNTFSNGKYGVYANPYLHPARGKKGIYQAKGVISYADGKMVIISDTVIANIKDRTEKDYKEIIFRSDNRDECESFRSWINTKLVRFLVGINISKRGSIFTDDYFRFVPAPPPTPSGNPWDHIYTDQELYEYFKLPQEYIDVIEAVIKERT